MKMPQGKRATPVMVAAANPPSGYAPIVSTSAFGWENGPIFEKVDNGVFQRGFRVMAKHTNAGGAVHGGMIMTFADILLARGVGDLADPPFVTVRCTTDFVGPAFEGEWVFGTANPYAVGEDMVAVNGTIKTETRIVASTQGLFKLIRRR
ncbi:PaaI family thioesterase [Kordiimonas aquimaris]|uniref:PaaI family thioesterase n=1 Tax=Kordiimonas aquimaris TaxID=707591 RepID=UPI0021CE457E|nr:PaaI family thioesterase [Kordiimonas aquimaris]